MKQLKNRGFIESETELKFTDKAHALINDKSLTPKKSEVDWVDEFRDLWPAGQFSGGYRIKGDRRACQEKLKQFLKDYPEYDKDTILAATKRYLERKERENWQFVQLAHYFISKNKVSTLATECEALRTETTENNSAEFQEDM